MCRLGFLVCLYLTILLIYPSQGQTYDVRDWYRYDQYRQAHQSYEILGMSNTLDQAGCTGTIFGDDILISPLCLTQPKELIDIRSGATLIWPYIDHFVGGYLFDQDSFDYTGSSIVWKQIPYTYYQTYDISRLLQAYQGGTDTLPSVYHMPKQDPWTLLPLIQIGEQDHQIALGLHKQGVRLKIPLLARAKIQMSLYRFSVVERNLREYGPCSKQNYILAWEALHDLYLKPGESFTINPLLAGLDGYCQGATPGQYLFYAGVCGVSTQLFRTSLLTPGLKTTQREGHGERYTKYYGEKVVGDDAAIYEYRKQFTIQNQSSRPILIKGWNKDDSHYLVALTLQSPDHSNHRVRVSKQEIGELAGEVSKTVWSGNTIIETGTRTSHYIRKNREQN